MIRSYDATVLPIALPPARPEFNGSVSVGAQWQLDSLIAGITPLIAYPQPGNVTA